MRIEPLQVRCCFLFTPAHSNYHDTLRVEKHVFFCLECRAYELHCLSHNRRTSQRVQKPCMAHHPPLVKPPAFLSPLAMKQHLPLPRSHPECTRKILCATCTAQQPLFSIFRHTLKLKQACLQPSSSVLFYCHQTYRSSGPPVSVVPVGQCVVSTAIPTVKP